MGTIEEGREVQVVHRVHWPEPFRAIVIRFEDDDRVLVRALDPVVGMNGETIFDEGEYLVVEVKYIANDNR